MVVKDVDVDIEVTNWEKLVKNLPTHTYFFKIIDSLILGAKIGIRNAKTFSYAKEIKSAHLE